MRIGTPAPHRSEVRETASTLKIAVENRPCSAEPSVPEFGGCASNRICKTFGFGRRGPIEGPAEESAARRLSGGFAVRHDHRSSGSLADFADQPMSALADVAGAAAAHASFLGDRGRAVGLHRIPCPRTPCRNSFCAQDCGSRPGRYRGGLKLPSGDCIKFETSGRHRSAREEGPLWLVEFSSPWRAFAGARPPWPGRRRNGSQTP